jgi:chromosome segregation ATPase
MMITGEYKVKRQKNGNVHNYVYYHCSKKSKLTKCTELGIRHEELNKQLSELLQKFSLPKDWANELLEMIERDKEQAAQSSEAFVQEAGNRIRAIQEKQQRLLDSYLEQDIERETYLKKKAELMLEKKTLEEKITTLEQRQTAWVEPLRKWIKEADSLQKIAGADDPFAKKVISKKIFGSNLFLTGKTVIEGEKKLANLGHKRRGPP